MKKKIDVGEKNYKSNVIVSIEVPVRSNAVSRGSSPAGDALSAVGFLTGSHIVLAYFQGQSTLFPTHSVLL